MGPFFFFFYVVRMLTYEFAKQWIDHYEILNDGSCLFSFCFLFFFFFSSSSNSNLPPPL